MQKATAQGVPSAARCLRCSFASVSAPGAVCCSSSRKLSALRHEACCAARTVRGTVHDVCPSTLLNAPRVLDPAGRHLTVTLAFSLGVLFAALEACAFRRVVLPPICGHVCHIWPKGKGKKEKAKGEGRWGSAAGRAENPTPRLHAHSPKVRL